MQQTGEIMKLGSKKVRKRNRYLQNPLQITEETNMKENMKWDNEEKFKLLQQKSNRKMEK